MKYAELAAKYPAVGRFIEVMANHDDDENRDGYFEMEWVEPGAAVEKALKGLSGVSLYKISGWWQEDDTLDRFDAANPEFADWCNQNFGER